MDLNLLLPDSNMEGGAPSHSTVESVHPPNNHENVVEQVIKEQKALDKIPNWLAQLVVKGNNQHKVLKQFQKLTHQHSEENQTQYK